MTTAPGLRAAADRLSANDYGYLAVDYLGRIGNGISLVFLTISWPITAFVFLFLVYWFTEGEIYGRPAYFILTLSVLIYISMKFIFLNDISAAIPGLAFLSPDLARLAIWGTPFAVALFSSLVTWLFYLRREGADFSVMRAYLSIVLLDFALSMAIYSIGHFE